MRRELARISSADGREASFADRILPRDPQTGFPRGTAAEMAKQSASCWTRSRRG